MGVLSQKPPEEDISRQEKRSAMPHVVESLTKMRKED